jgi:histidinol-phosphate aminotransferase
LSSTHDDSESLLDLVREELSQLDAYVPHAAPSDAIRLDANESPPLPEDVTAALARVAAEVSFERYPDARATRLRAAIARWCDCSPDQLVVGTGSDEVIGLLLSSLSRARPGRSRPTCLFPTPTFVMYRVSALAAGVVPIGVPLDARWDLDVDAIERAIDAREPNVIFLASPNNPTANCFSQDRVERVIELARGRSLVVLDEAYAPFSGRTYAATMSAHPHTVARLGTLSKIGLAALRVGWAVLPRELAREVDKARQPFNVDAVAQRIAAEALEQHDAALRTHAREIAARRGALADQLAMVPGITVFASDANFLWVDVHRDAGPVFDELLARGVLVRSFHRAGGRLASCLRVTVSTEEHHRAFVSALRGALAH